MNSLQSREGIGETNPPTTTSSERGTVNAAIEGDDKTTPFNGERQLAVIEKPPSDDVCPICFGNFNIPCRTSCGHWYCGSCILRYWRFSAVYKPCKCPMCQKRIVKLIPEKSLYLNHEVEISKVLQDVNTYNRTFVGGFSGYVLNFLSMTSLCMKRMFLQMLNPDRPGAYLNQIRLFGLLLGIIYSFSPFDFLRIGHYSIFDVFDLSAIVISFLLYLVRYYRLQRHAQDVRELLADRVAEDD